MGEIVLFPTRRPFGFRSSPSIVASTLYPADVFLLVISAIPAVTIFLSFVGAFR